MIPLFSFLKGMKMQIKSLHLLPPVRVVFLLALIRDLNRSKYSSPVGCRSSPARRG